MTIGSAATSIRGSVRSPARLALAVVAGVVASSMPSYAQGLAPNIETYFPSGVAGYDQQLGVTVLSRLRPLYESEGVQLGGFTVRSGLDQSIFDNSNVNGTPVASGSWGSHTSASASAISNWGRDSFAATIGMDNFRYFALPGDNHTDWNLGIGGGYTIADSQLTLAFSHQTYNQLGSTIGSIPTQTPVVNEVNSVRTDYTFQFGNITITPDLSASAYRFGTATVAGVSINQQFLDNNVAAGGLTARYSRGEAGGLLLVVRGFSSNYINPLPGQPSNDSSAALLLAGLDYQAAGVLRYRFLAGVEIRTFAAQQLATSTYPIVDGSVIWTPTGLTTVTGFVSRRIEAPETVGINGYYILTQGRVVVDHELRRNILLQARAGVQLAQYLQSGSQTNITIGGGVTWLINPHVRLSANYDFTKQGAVSNAGTPVSQSPLVTGRYTQNLLSLTLRFSL